MILLFAAGPVQSTFIHCPVAFCNRAEECSEVISSRAVSHIVPDKVGKFRDPGLNRSLEIRIQIAIEGIFVGFFVIFRPQVVSDVISGTSVEEVELDPSV